jgi:hypothetical protein
MNRKTLNWIALLGTLMFALLACDVMSVIPGLPAAQQQMWSDVPAFTGATQDAKEALGAGVFNQAQADQKSKMETLLFRTTKPPADVAAFYTDDRMGSLGWTPQGLGNAKSGCYQDNYEGQPRAICQFVKKNEEGRAIDLTIDARNDPQAKNTRLTYVRITGSLTSAAPTTIAIPTQVMKAEPTKPIASASATPTLESAGKLPSSTAVPGGTNFDGEWKGVNSANTPVQFTVKNNQVTYINPNYAVKSGTCSLSGGFSKSVNAPIVDKSFSVATTDDDGKQFTFTGKFISNSEASGTLRVKADKSFCGAVDGEMTWSAKNGATTIAIATATRVAPPTSAIADGPDATAVKKFFDAINAKNLDGALALVGDNVIYTFGATSGIGKAGLRTYLSAQIAAGANYQLSNVKTNPAAVTFTAQAGATTYAQGQAMFTDGKIVILTVK